MKRQNITITVFDACIYDRKGWPPESAAGCLAWFADKIGKIPREHRNAARIEFDSEGGYEGEHYPHILIEYSRKETIEEAKEREAKEVAQQVANERRERQMLADLSKKYGRAKNP